MNENEVLDFLLTNPDFLAKNPKTLLHMRLSTNKSDDSISLNDYQTKLLQEDNKKLSNELAHIIDISDFNYNEQLKLQKFILKIISKTKKEELVSVLTKDLLKDFSLLESKLIIWGEHKIHAKRKTKLFRYIDGKKPYFGTINVDDNDILFSKENNSIAILPIKSFNYGLLAVSAKDNRFIDNRVSANLLLFLTNIIYLLLQRLKFIDG